MSSGGGEGTKTLIGQMSRDRDEEKERYITGVAAIMGGRNV